MKLVSLAILDSIAVSVFVVILVDFDKYWDEKACPLRAASVRTIFLLIAILMHESLILLIGQLFACQKQMYSKTKSFQGPKNLSLPLSLLLIEHILPSIVVFGQMT